jgi:hypothetical protein
MSELFALTFTERPQFSAWFAILESVLGLVCLGHTIWQNGRFGLNRCFRSLWQLYDSERSSIAQRHFLVAENRHCLGYLVLFSV